jgi:hypothetical protein
MCRGREVYNGIVKDVCAVIARAESISIREDKYKRKSLASDSDTKYFAQLFCALLEHILRWLGCSAT